MLLIICHIAAKKIVTFRPETGSYNAVSTLSQLGLFTPLVVSVCGIRDGIESLWSVKIENRKERWAIVFNKDFPYPLISSYSSFQVSPFDR